MMLIKKSIIALLTIFLLALMAVPAMAGTTDNTFNPFVAFSFLPPLGADSPSTANFDPSLANYLTVKVSEFTTGDVVAKLDSLGKGGTRLVLRTIIIWLIGRLKVSLPAVVTLLL